MSCTLLILRGSQASSSCNFADLGLVKREFFKCLIPSPSQPCSSRLKWIFWNDQRHEGEKNQKRRRIFERRGNFRVAQVFVIILSYFTTLQIFSSSGNSLWSLFFVQFLLFITASLSVKRVNWVGMNPCIEGILSFDYQNPLGLIANKLFKQRIKPRER